MAALAAFLLLSLASAPVDGSSPAAVCTGTLGRERVVQCALAASPALQSAEIGVEALAGRRQAARTVLPSNPAIEVTAASRHGVVTGDRDINVYGRLSQELEVAGQRRKRVALVDAEIAGQQRRVEAVRREVAAAASQAYFELVAAHEEQAMLGRVARAMQSLVELAAAGEKAGLTSGLAADVAAAASVRIARQQVEAERRLVTARALLASLIGQDPAAPRFEVALDMTAPASTGELPALIELALQRRAELGVVQAEQEAQRRQMALYRRARVPNPSLVAYAQRDGFNERVLGGGIAIPIPLPSPLGRTFAGEIAESKARVRQGDAEIERLRREIRAEVVVAYHAVRARQAELALFDPARVSRAEAHIEALAQEMAAGRLQIREAVLLQQSFLELLAAHVAARRALALAAVELLRVTGQLVPGATR
jgi:cobalt-zinc-cadmium efflux system outer membrane protein